MIHLRFVINRSRAGFNAFVLEETDKLQGNDWSWMSCVFDVVDAILIPTPFYGIITEDLHLYSDVRLFHVPLDCEVGILAHLQSLLCACVQTV